MTADTARNVRRSIVELESQNSPIGIKGSHTDVAESYGTLPVAFGLESWNVVPGQVQQPTAITGIAHILVDVHTSIQGQTDVQRRPECWNRGENDCQRVRYRQNVSEKAKNARLTCWD